MIDAGLKNYFPIAESSTADKTTLSLQQGLNGTDEKKLVKAAKEFESFMYSTMFKSMYQSMPKSEFVGSSQHQEIFMDMYIDEASKMTQNSTHGIAQLLIKQYKQNMANSTNAVDKIHAHQLDPTQNVTDVLAQERMSPLCRDENDIREHLLTFVQKLEHSMSSQFGERVHPITGQNGFHKGVDYALSQGTDVKAPTQGRVIQAGTAGGYGKLVTVDHGGGWHTKYAHLSEITVKEGDQVKPGSLLGKVGSTGFSTGPHLHLEVLKDGQPVDPRGLQFLRNEKTKVSSEELR